MEDSLKYLKEFISKEVDSFLESFGFNHQKTFIPLPAVKNTALNALNIVQDKKNVTADNQNEGSGKGKARELSSGIGQTHVQMKRLKSYFDNNQESYTSEVRQGKTMQNSDIILMWNLHGGDAAKNWVNSQISNVKDSNMRTDKNKQLAGGAGSNKGKGVFDTGLMDTTKQRIHK